MILETHAHSLGGSHCAECPADKLIDFYVEKGYNGIVLTNHICYDAYKNYPGDSHKEKMDYYLSLFDDFKQKGEQKGLKIFLGAEVRSFTTDNTYMEYMLYGFDRKLLYDNKPLFQFTQEELFKLSEKNGLFMYQTHPFRHIVTLGNPKFMHGAESFNGHKNHFNFNAMANKFCDDNNLIKMSGTDYHEIGQGIIGGIIVPDDIDSERKLTDYIFNHKLTLVCDTALYEKLLRERKFGV